VLLQPGLDAHPGVLLPSGGREGASSGGDEVVESMHVVLADLRLLGWALCAGSAGVPRPSTVVLRSQPQLQRHRYELNRKQIEERIRAAPITAPLAL